MNFQIVSQPLHGLTLGRRLILGAMSTSLVFPKGTYVGEPENSASSTQEVNFPATLSRSGIFGEISVKGMVYEFDEMNCRLKASKSLPVGSKVRMKFRLQRAMSYFFRGLACDFKAHITQVKAKGKDSFDLTLSWEEPLSLLVKKAISSYQRKIGFLIGSMLVFAVWWKWKNLDYFWYNPFFYVYSMSLLSYLLSRFIISWRYRPPEMTGYTPSISIVIAVKNEEKAIGRTIDTCYGADYPNELREVIVVNDGSTDGTLQVLDQMREKYPGLKVINIKPSGKRHGMAAGVKAATGEIIVFVDSDTFLFKDALRNIVCGFEDPTLGASAGWTEVENPNVNTLTGFQEVRYAVSFRLLKSAESYYDAVTCCPGCLSAYRREYLMEILDEWLNQRFLGAPATFGDDRSLTNYILRKYRVIYNENALASTIVPVTWSHYLRQQVRWKKSWLREAWIASGFMWKKHPVAALSFYASAFFSMFSPIVAVRVIYLEMQGYNTIFLYYLVGLITVGLIQSLYFLYKRPSSHWLLGMFWMASSLVLTGPQTYYALLTLRKNHWGTR